MKILNLYAGIGGNRKFWGNDIDIVAVEYDERIAAIYQDLYPNDKVVIGDAHQYLLENYQDFDFIWASPPCPTHSVTNHFLNAQGVRRYPDMSLYQEIILLENFYSKGGGKYVVENVVSYYDPLIPPQKSGRHYFWANFKIPNIPSAKIGRMDKLKDGSRGDKKENLKALGIDLSDYVYPNKDKLLRNCVDPKVGLAIFQSAQDIYRHNNTPKVGLFG
jgi:DNA (cytosine-5)-methyltransferase 1